MIDRAALEAILVQYKSDFVATTWPEEKYKWQAVKHFQDHWRPDAQDFSEMLKAALGRTENLLVSMNNFPRRMIEEFAEAEPERVRTMFVALFDESNDLVRRVEAFKQESQELLRLHGARSHYQTENAISTYLWLRYPDTHYVYKWSQCRRVSHALGAGFVFKQGDYAANLRDHHEMYDQICEVVRSDAELRTLLDSQLTPDCYPDPEMRTLTGDVAYYVAQMPDDKDEGVDEDGRWWPSSDEYSPGLAVEDWVRLLRDRNVFDEGSMEVVNRLKDIAGRATCRELATRYGRTPQFYNGTSSALAKRVVTATGCPTVPGDEDGSTRWWPVLYTGRRSTTEEDGTYVWRLRDELSQALDQVDALAVSSPADEPTESAGRDLDPLAKPQPLVDYTKQDFLSEVYMPESDYDRLVDVLRRKKNIILQGAPGVGKTFAAKRLAWSMMGMKDPDRIEFVQFHQNYSYEDFVMGYKPSATGFSLRKGVFQTFCTRAADHPDQEFFFSRSIEVAWGTTPSTG